LDDLRILVDLLEHFSPTGQEKDAVDCLILWMETLGYEAAIDAAGNAVGTRGDGPNEVLLLGHIDTVPGEIPVRIEGDTLWGRGAVDAKGPLACFTTAGARVSVPPGWRLTVIGAVAEEGDSHGARFLRDRRPSQALIIGEPSGWDRLTLGYKGSAWFDYTVRRSLAHTAARAQSASEAAVEFWNRLRAAADHFNQATPKAFEQLLPTLREMTSSSDGFAETARLRIGLRLPPSLSVETTHAMLAALAGNGELAFLDGIPAYRAEKNTPLVRAFLAGIRAAGGQPGFTLKTGTSDMNIVAPAWNCPTLAYGPGDSDLDHTPDEHIQISEYRKAVGVLASSLERLFTGSEM
jgi:LysW-gamma-L-lysine carboxypeptidase